MKGNNRKGRRPQPYDTFGNGLCMPVLASLASCQPRGGRTIGLDAGPFRRPLRTVGGGLAWSPPLLPNLPAPVRLPTGGTKGTVFLATDDHGLLVLPAILPTVDLVGPYGDRIVYHKNKQYSVNTLQSACPTATATLHRMPQSGRAEQGVMSGLHPGLHHEFIV